jgi:hypothetical protein
MGQGSASGQGVRGDAPMSNEDALADELTGLLERYDVGGPTRTDAGVLAEYVLECLRAYTWVIGARAQWNRRGAEAAGRVPTEDEL